MKMHARQFMPKPCFKEASAQPLKKLDSYKSECLYQSVWSCGEVTRKVAVCTKKMDRVGLQVQFPESPAKFRLSIALCKGQHCHTVFLQVISPTVIESRFTFDNWTEFNWMNGFKVMRIRCHRFSYVCNRAMTDAQKCVTDWHHTGNRDCFPPYESWLMPPQSVMGDLAMPLVRLLSTVRQRFHLMLLTALTQTGSERDKNGALKIAQFVPLEVQPNIPRIQLFLICLYFRKSEK